MTPVPRILTLVISSDRHWPHDGPGGCCSAPQRAHAWTRSSPRCSPCQKNSVSLLMTGLTRTGGIPSVEEIRAGSWLSLAGPAQDECAGRYRGAGRDEDVLRIGDLVRRRSAELPHGLGDGVHAVHVALPDLAAMRIQRKRSVHRQRTRSDELGAFSRQAESQCLELEQDARREVVVQHGRVHVGGSETALLPEPGADRG